MSLVSATLEIMYGTQSFYIKKTCLEIHNIFCTWQQRHLATSYLPCLFHEFGRIADQAYFVCFRNPITNTPGQSRRNVNLENEIEIESLALDRRNCVLFPEYEEYLKAIELSDEWVTALKSLKLSSLLSIIIIVKSCTRRDQPVKISSKDDVTFMRFFW